MYSRLATAKIFISDGTEAGTFEIYNDGSLDGNFIEEVVTGLGMPTSVSIQGDFVSVPDLHGRLVILDKNNTIAFTYGITDDVVSGINFGIWHKLSKMTHAYVALNSTSDEVTGSSAADDDFLVIGLREKF